MTDTSLQRTNPTVEPQSGNQDLMHLIQRGYEVAIEKGAAIEVVQSILTEMRLQRDREERATFQAALRRIQDNLKEIRKRGRNDDTHSDYVKEIDIDREINQQLQTEGMTLSFEPRVSERPEMVLIVGLLSLGAYTREYPLEMPADGKGPKGGGVMSRTHATGSAITYAKRYLKGMIFNLTYAGKDDDGNAAAGGESKVMDESAIGQWIASIESSGDMEELQTRYLEARDAATEAKDEHAEKMFRGCKNLMCKKFSKSGAK